MFIRLTALAVICCAVALAQTNYFNSNIVTEGTVNSCVDTSSTANTLICSNPTGATISSYNSGAMWTVKVSVTNTGASTLKIDSGAAVAVKKMVSGSLADLDPGDLVANDIAQFSYSGTVWILQNPRSSPSVSSVQTNSGYSGFSAQSTASSGGGAFLGLTSATRHWNFVTNAGTPDFYFQDVTGSGSPTRMDFDASGNVAVGGGGSVSATNTVILTAAGCVQFGAGGATACPSGTGNSTINLSSSNTNGTILALNNTNAASGGVHNYQLQTDTNGGVALNDLTASGAFQSYFRASDRSFLSWGGIASLGQGTQPTCDSNSRGLIWVSRNDTLGDSVQVCVNRTSSAGYGWVHLYN